MDADHVSRFNFEVSLADARPLYFCDADGTRAGVMWYIRRVTVDKVGEIVARRDAEEIGLTDAKSQFWLAANVYLSTPEARRPSPPPAPDVPTPRSRPPPAPAPVDRKRPPVRPTAPLERPAAPSAGRRPRIRPTPRRDSATRRPGSRSPALVVDRLGIPLAYVGRSIPSGVISLARASLPGPRRSQKSLPGASDV